jgi:hypothetical protein
MRGAIAKAALICWCGTAQGFRPFDGPDAAVADPGEFEVELGPAEYLREGSERVLFAPDFRVNYGFTPDWEATIEGDLVRALSAAMTGTRLVGNTASLKGVLRERSLQEKLGPSIATEFNVPLPGIHDEGPHDWPVRPLCQFSYELDVGHFENAAHPLRSTRQSRINDN